MSDIVRRIPNEPIIIVKPPPLQPDQGQSTVTELVAALIKDIEGKVFRIMDLTDFNINFSDMMQQMAREASGEPGTASDPRIQDVLVSTNDLLKLAAKSMGQQQYLGHEVPIFPTVDEALAYARAELAK